MKPYVITGGPCVGKTTVIGLLKDKGYAIVPEASRMIIEEELQKKSDVVPWKNIEQFQTKVADKQIELETKEFSQITFLDRGLVDGYAYCTLNNAKVPEVIASRSKDRYEKVFLLEQLATYTTDDSRIENKNNAVKIQSEIKKAYLECGYELISVPPLPPEDRVNFILKTIQ